MSPWSDIVRTILKVSVKFCGRCVALVALFLLRFGRFGESGVEFEDERTSFAVLEPRAVLGKLSSSREDGS